MRRGRRYVALFGFACVWLLPSFAWGDSITLEANPVASPEIFPGPSRVELFYHIETEPTAFVGISIKAGATAVCAVNYSQDLQSQGTFNVNTNERPDGKLLADDLEGGVGEIATVPGGGWSLCGWVQPEGNTSMAIPSAAAGPVRFTVAGPGGATMLSVPPTVPAGGALQVTVQYDTQEIAGEYLGTTTSSLYVTASPGTVACLPPESASPRFLDVAGTQDNSVPVVENQPGTATFETTVPAGTYSVCTYMFQTFPLDNTPGILPQAFATSAATTTVLASSPTPPSPSVLTTTVAAHNTQKQRVCTTVRSADAVALVTETGSSCAVARMIVQGVIRKTVDTSRHSRISKTGVRVPAPGGSFVCHTRDLMASRYNIECDRGHAVVDAKVTSHRVTGMRTDK